jgi:putative oxidoreductase
VDLLPLDPLVVLRVLCGIWFLPHCIGKARNVAGAAGTFERAGFPAPRTVVLVTIAVEIAAAAGLVTGVFEDAAAALAVAVLAGASYAVLKINGLNWRWQRQGPEFMVFWAAACIVAVSG